MKYKQTNSIDKTDRIEDVYPVVRLALNKLATDEVPCRSSRSIGALPVGGELAVGGEAPIGGGLRSLAVDSRGLDVLRASSKSQRLAVDLDPSAKAA